MIERNKPRAPIYQVSSKHEESTPKLPITYTLHDDIPEIAGLEKQFYSKEAYPALFFYQALRQWPRTFLTVKVDGKAAGYSLMVPVSDCCLSLMSLLVGKMFQGRGLGKQLLSESVALARNLDYKQIELSVSPENRLAVALYQSFGFTSTETVNNYLGPGEDRLLMNLSLEDD